MGVRQGFEIPADVALCHYGCCSLQVCGRQRTVQENTCYVVLRVT